MTAPVWMITWLLLRLLPVRGVSAAGPLGSRDLATTTPAAGELPRPVNVIFNSSHFIHLLQWEPGPGTPPGVHYQVTVRGDMVFSWQPVAGCQHVRHPLICDLTRAFPDRLQHYFARVRARLRSRASQEVTSEEFLPIERTHLDLPLLTVTVCDRSLCVDLQPPMEHLRDVYENLVYRLRIQNDGPDEEHTEDVGLQRREILESLAPGRKYCVSVRFWDSKSSRTSDYSEPACVSTPSKYNKDWVISGVACSMVLLAVGLLLLLFSAGFFCLTGRLPHVLTSIRHSDGVVVVSPHRTSLSSLLNVKVTAPSAGGKRSSRTSSDESDGESQTEDTGGSSSRGGGGLYKLRVGTNLHSSSSSSSSSLSPEPGATATSSDSVSPQLDHLTGPSSPPDPLPDSDPPADCWTGGANKEEEEEKQEEEEEQQKKKKKEEEEEEQKKREEEEEDVNLLTLTFGRREEEEEESQVDSSCPSEVLNTAPLLPAQTWDAEEVAMETVPSSVNEEEEEEEEEEDDDCGYMRR